MILFLLSEGDEMTEGVSRQEGYRTVFPILVAVSFCHFLNDLMQSLLPAMYPLLKTGFQLSFAHGRGRC
jgi:MFS transporter, FSR family, fosmidomycin resistance protein